MKERDIYSQIQAARALPNSTATAGGAGDNTEVDGPTIDRTALTDRGQSAALFLNYPPALASAQSLAVSVQFQDSADGSSWDDLGAAQVQTVLGGAGGTFTGVLKYRYTNFHLARRYVRAQVTPNLSASGTDTSGISGILVVGGQDELPT
jgi:hypothetical protein